MTRDFLIDIQIQVGLAMLEANLVRRRYSTAIRAAMPRGYLPLKKVFQ